MYCFCYSWLWYFVDSLILFRKLWSSSRVSEHPAVLLLSCLRPLLYRLSITLSFFKPPKELPSIAVYTCFYFLFFSIKAFFLTIYSVDTRFAYANFCFHFPTPSKCFCSTATNFSRFSLINSKNFQNVLVFFCFLQIIANWKRLAAIMLLYLRGSLGVT